MKPACNWKKKAINTKNFWENEMDGSIHYHGSVFKTRNLLLLSCTKFHGISCTISSDKTTLRTYNFAKFKINFNVHFVLIL